MSKRESIKKNIGFQTAYQILNTCLPLITAPYLARVLGAEQIGVFSYTSSIVAYFTLISLLGTINYGTRSIASVKENKKELSRTFCSIYTLQALLTGCVIIIYIVYLIFICNENRIIATIQIITIIDCFLNISWFFFGLERFQLTVTINFFVRILSVTAILFFVNKNSDLWIYTLIMTSSTLLSNAILWIYLPKAITRCKVKVKDFLPHIKPNLILFVPLLAMSVYHTMDKTMLGLLSSYEQSGFYYNSDKVINIPVGILTGVSTVLLPRMTSLTTMGKKRESDRLFKLSLEGVVVLSVAIAFGISAVAKEFTPVFFGPGYDECVILMIVLSPVLILKGFSISVRNQFLIPYKLEKIFILSVIMGAIVNLFINGVLIPSLGALGAIIGTLIAEFVACVVQFWIVRKYIKLGKVYKDTIIYSIIGLGMFICVRFIAKLSLNIYMKLAVEITAGAVFYIIVCFLYWKITNNVMYKEIFGSILNKLY